MIGAGNNFELRPTPQPPVRRVNFTLPDIEGAGVDVKLGMHTDTMRNFLTVLDRLDQQDELPQLRIQGRVVTPTQWARLQAHPVYRFYLQARATRGLGAEAAGITPSMYSLVVPQDLEVNADGANALARSPFRPESLATDIGFRTGFYDAQVLLAYWKENNRNPNVLLGQLGGLNQFEVGSDEMTRLGLEAFVRTVARQLADMDAHVGLNSGFNYLNTGLNSNPYTSPKLPSSYNIIPLTHTLPDIKQIADVYNLYNSKLPSDFSSSFKSFKKDIIDIKPIRLEKLEKKKMLDNIKDSSVSSILGRYGLTPTSSGSTGSSIIDSYLAQLAQKQTGLGNIGGFTPIIN